MHTKIIVITALFLIVLLGVSGYIVTVQQHRNSIDSQPIVSPFSTGADQERLVVQPSMSSAVPLTRRCRADADCMLGNDAYCEYVVAFNKNYQEQWLEENIEDAALARKEERTCEPMSDSTVDINNFTARCLNNLCQIAPK